MPHFQKGFCVAVYTPKTPSVTRKEAEIYFGYSVEMIYFNVRQSQICLIFEPHLRNWTTSMAAVLVILTPHSAINTLKSLILVSDLRDDRLSFPTVLKPPFCIPSCLARKQSRGRSCKCEKRSCPSLPFPQINVCGVCHLTAQSEAPGELVVLFH